MDVILPAGGRIKGAFAAQAGTQVKALLRVGGRTLLERMLDTLRATGRVGRAVVVGPDEVAAHPAARAADVVLPDSGSGVANVFRGLDCLADSGARGDRVLILATDLPLVTPESVTQFLDACPPEADIALPIIRCEEFQARFPEDRRRFVPLRDGAWTIGCAFLVNPAVMAQNRAHIERVFAARKASVAVLGLLGPASLARFLTGRLTIGHIEERCEQILRCRAQGARGCAPELAFDIDRFHEYRYTLLQEGET